MILPGTNLYGHSRPSLRALLEELGEAPYRGDQLFTWLYRKDVLDFEAMSNLPADLRKRLAETFIIERKGPVSDETSSDGTRKYLFQAGPMQKVEAVYIPEPDRATLCVSTQTGCKMACLFCMTARQGLQAQLSAGGIVAQYATLPERESITNFVYMGMGEPLDNLDAVLESIKLLEEGYGFSPRRITVSTIGVLPALRRLVEETKVNLAISLHSPFHEERKRLMPIEAAVPVTTVLDTLRDYDFSNRKLSMEYILFDGVNDSLRHAAAIVQLVNGLRCRINLLYFHAIPGSPLRPSPSDRVEEFRSFLEGKGLIATVRKSRGEDISAACGMLSTKHLLEKKSSAPEPADY